MKIREVPQARFLHVLILIFLSGLLSASQCGSSGSGSSSSSTDTATTVSTLTIDSDGDFVLNGANFLPIILYDAGLDVLDYVNSANPGLGISNRHATLLAQFTEIQGKGFNTVIVAPFEDYEFTTEDFSVAREVGLYVIPRSTSDIVADTEQFEELEGQSNLLMWNTFDEPDAYSGGLTTARSLYQTVRGQDSRPVIVPIADVAQYDDATDLTDALLGGAYFLLYSDQPQPISLANLLSGYSSPPYSDFASVQGFMTSARAAVRTGTSGKTFIPIVNICPYTTAAEPTADQVRAMSFLALLYHAKGLAYFAYVTDDPDASATLSSGRDFCYVPEGSSGLWEGFDEVLDDVDDIKDYVFAGDYSGTVTANDSAVHVAAKTISSDRAWVMAVNTAGTSVSGVTLSVGASATSVSDLLSGTTYTPSGQTFTDSFSAYGVRVYDVRF